MRIIGGKHRGTKLYTLDGLNTRPTLDRVKESLFSILQFELPEATGLDLFAGSGALGLESISRGASKVILCDQSKNAIHIIEQNVEKLKEKSQVQKLKQDKQVLPQKGLQIQAFFLRQLFVLQILFYMKKIYQCILQDL